MDKFKDFVEAAKGLVNITQFGLYIATPVVLMALLGIWLKKKFLIPDLLLALLILLGVAAGVFSAVRFVKSYLARIDAAQKKKEQEKAKEIEDFKDKFEE